MSQKLTLEQEKEVKDLESKGDASLEKETFEGCLEAQALYLEAMELMQKYAQDDTIDDGIGYPHFKTDIISYKNWYFAIENKIIKSSSVLANPKIARR